MHQWSWKFLIPEKLTYQLIHIHSKNICLLLKESVTIFIVINMSSFHVTLLDIHEAIYFNVEIFRLQSE